jgi:hypothetical protein
VSGQLAAEPARPDAVSPAAPRRRGATLALAAGALLLPVRSVEQAVFAASFAAAMATLWLWGRALGRLALGLPRLAPCTAVYLGQFALLAAAAPATAVNGVSAALLGGSLPLAALVVPATLGLLVCELRAARQSIAERPARRIDLLALLAFGSVAVVVAVYSRHLSALGLDIHEHTAWVRQIVMRGYVPLAEPGTTIVGDYPRSFHLLTALWNAAGLTAPAGPFAKAMPFLQTALPALAVGELLVEASARVRPSLRRGWEVAVGLTFYVYAFLLVPMVYPVVDLIGTPRFSSNGLLLLPIVLVIAGHVCEAPRAAWASLAVLPLLCAWALTWNPIVVLLLAAVTVPVLAAFSIALRPANGGAFPCRGGLAALAVSGALGALVLVQDPWVTSMVAGRSTAYSALLHRCGLVTFDEAVQQGLATAREKSVRAAVPAPSCHDARCVMDVAGATAREALMLPARAVRSAAEDLTRLARAPSVPATRYALKGALPFQPPILADHAGLPFFAILTAGTLIMAWRTVRRRRVLRPPPGPANRMVVASLVGIGVAGVLLRFAAGLAAALSDQQHDSNILAGYLGSAGAHVAAGFLWLPFVAAWVVLAEPLVASSAAIGGKGAFRSRWRAVLAGAGLVLWIALPFLARLNLDVPMRQRGFWGPIGLRDLLALRRVEAAIPPGDGVVVPAAHWNIAQWEHWVIPIGETTALLPYGERRYLFDVYLGASYPLSWRDLEGRLCSRDPAVRVRFLDRTRARWLLVRDPGARDAADALRRQRMCGESLSALGADLPAERVDDGIYLFRLRRG